MFLRFKIIFLYFQVEGSNTGVLVNRLLTVLVIMTVSRKLTNVPVYSPPSPHQYLHFYFHGHKMICIFKSEFNCPVVCCEFGKFL